MTMNLGQSRLVARGAWVIFGLSVMIHVTAVLGVNWFNLFPPIMLMHLVVFIPFIALVMTGGGRMKGRDFFGPIPIWGRVVMGLVLVYTILNFFYFMQLSEGGGPSIVDGQFVIQSHGTIIREITEAEYNRQQAYVVRGFSGHWMLFALAPALFFTFGRDK
ncbi:MAG TPA: hypothetical protein VLL52_14405 [Anaerolineae bacterium]|nr:hypothetical protein [Anaerolineae bacterium]